MDTLKKLLAFCNLLEYDGNRLSITNIALIILLGKLALSNNVDWPSIVAVIASFANYAHKRQLTSQGPDEK